MGSLEQGASNAVSVCMGLKPGEKVLIVTDRAQKEVGEALRREAERITPSNVMFFVLEDISKRPLSSLPKSIEDSIRVANVTLWAENIDVIFSNAPTILSPTIRNSYIVSLAGFASEICLG